MTPSKGGDAAAAGSKASAPEAGESAGNKPLTMRGRKRHKCMVCGNIARSRCPFLSCKGCCVKAGNPCQIHVLKASPSGENLQGPAATAPAAQGPVVSNIVRHNPYDSLRLRTVRPLALLTKKEAFYINSWRFRKLRAHTEAVTQLEDDSFDRYMQNILLLEELFHADSRVQLTLSRDSGGSSNEKSKSDEELDVAVVSAGLRLRQRSSSKKREAHKQKLKRIIDRGLQKLHKGEELEDMPENEDLYVSAFAARRELKRMKVQSVDGKERLRRMEVFSVLVEKLKAVENQDDYDLCLKMYEDNFLNNKTCTLKGEDFAQMADTEEHKNSGMDAPAHTDKPTDNCNVPSLTCDASFKSRLDSFGVKKQWWEVEATSLDRLDVPLSNLESL